MTKAYLLEEQRPKFSAEDAVNLAREAFGVSGKVRPLPSERDQNFHLLADSGDELVLKIAGAAESRDVLDLQNQALNRLAEDDPSVPVPRLIRNLAGHSMQSVDSNGRTHWIRLLTYLPGTVLAEVRPHTDALLRDLGRKLGQMDSALRGFSHPAAHRDLYWNLTRAREVIEQNRSSVNDPTQSGMLDTVIDRWEAIVAPPLDALRRSVIYNDANDFNVLVDPPGTHRHITGFVDFGDMLESATVCNPAIAAAYAALSPNQPINAAAQVIAGYHEAFPLTEQELELLPTLIAARLAVSVCVSAQRRVEEPEREYLVISEIPAWAALERLIEIHPRLARDALRDACGFPACPSSLAVTAWLRDNTASFVPVLDLDPRHAARVTFDLSVGSPELEDPQHITGTVAFCALLEAGMREANADLGIGRYDEPRLFYAEHAFAASLLGSNEPRTIHLGVDLFAPPGTAVCAPLGGQVHSLRNNANRLDYGPTVIIEHAPKGGPRFYTLYGHLATDCLNRLTPGSTIAAGEAFAQLGAFEVNGNWPPHLHFQIITDVLERDGEFPGVAAPSERPVWLSLSPDPNLILGLPQGVRAESSSTDGLLAARHRWLGSSLSLAYHEPLHIVRGRAQYLYDVTGRQYLDCVNNVCHVGHCHPTVVRAAQKQIAVLNTNTRYLHEHILRYAERLCATFPEPLSVCFLVCSGSEANELAIRMARAHTERDDLVVVAGAYHGNTSTLVGASPYKFDGPGGKGPPRNVHQVVMPDEYRGPYRRDDPDRGRAYAAHVREALNASDGRAAAFLCESLLGCGGQIELPPGYLTAAFEHTRSAGAVCIIDEVQVGFGRVGTHFWGFESQDVVPDIVTLGKPIGNGHPLAAVVTTPEIAASFDTGMEYFNTFGGNPVSCAIGMAVLDVIEQEGLQQHAFDVGQRFKEGLLALKPHCPALGDVRGRGLFLGLEFVSDPDARTPAPGVAKYVVERMRDQGILLSTDGPDENVIKIKPPLPFNDSDVDRLLAVLAEVLEEDVVRYAG